MNLRLSIFLIFCWYTSISQSVKNVDSSSSMKPEIFTSGFIDIINSGQVNASARFIRLLIGEPGKFNLPLSFYGGVSHNNFQNQLNAVGQLKSNDHLVNQYINPMSGLVNISIDGIKYFGNLGKITKAGFMYFAGERLLTGFRTGKLNDPETGKPKNFLNTVVSLGTYFETGAWERNNAKNVGVCWLALRYIACYSNPKQIKDFLKDIETSGLYDGYSIGFGVEINKVVNMKIVYYKYRKKPEIDYSLPIYQFSFNYALKN